MDRWTVPSFLCFLAAACAAPIEPESASPTPKVWDRLDTLSAAARTETALEALGPIDLALGASDAAEQIAVLEGLSERGDLADPWRDKRTAEAVRALLAGSPIAEVRAAAAQALAAWFADPANVQLVRGAARSDSDPLVRARAIEVLVDSGV